MDTVDRIIALETGELSELDTIALFVDLLNTGTINHLQGSYGRTAQTLISNGYIGYEHSGDYYATGKASEL
jgi:hypothetical protein